MEAIIVRRLYIYLFVWIWSNAFLPLTKPTKPTPIPPSARTPPRASTVNNPISEVKVWVLSRWTMVEVLWEISTGPSYHPIRCPCIRWVGRLEGLWDFIVWWIVLHTPGLAKKILRFFNEWFTLFSFQDLVKHKKEGQVVFWKARFGEVFGNVL